MSQHLSIDILAPDNPPSPVHPVNPLADLIPEEVWINILEQCLPPRWHPDGFVTSIEDRLAGVEKSNSVPLELLSFRSVSKRYSTLATRVLFRDVRLSSVESYEQFSTVVSSSAQGPRASGPLVRCLILNFPEHQLWGTKPDGSKLDDAEAKRPAVGLLKLLLCLTGLQSLGSTAQAIKSPSFFSAVVFRASSARLALHSLFGVAITPTNITSSVLALGALRSTLEDLWFVPATQESSRFPIDLLPIYAFPLIHSIRIQAPGDSMAEDASSYRLQFAYDLLARWSFPCLRSLWIEEGLSPLDRLFPDPTPFLVKNGSKIADFGCDLKLWETDLVLYLTALPALVGLLVRPFDIKVGGVAQECFGRLETLVIVFDEDEFERNGWLDNFYDRIGRDRMPLLEHVVWDSLDQGDDTSTVPCWKKMLRFGARLEQEGVKFTWV